MAKSWMWVAMFLALLPSGAWAQEEPSEFGDDPEFGDTDNAEATEGDEADGDGDAESSEVVDPSADQWFVGVQWRQLLIPAFVQKIFLDEAPTVFQPTFQVVGTKRNSENFSLVFGLGYTSYAFEGLYRAKGDPIEDTEILNSNLGLVHGTFSALWAKKLNDVLDLEYGLGGELGIVTGTLHRSEAYPVGNGTWRACLGPLNPNAQYCDPTSVAYNQKGGQFNVVEKRIPPIFLLPTLFQLGLRITPIPEMMIKIEAAYATAAFWFGASVHLNLSKVM